MAPRSKAKRLENDGPGQVEASSNGPSLPPDAKLLALLRVCYGPVPKEVLRSIEAKVMEAIRRPGCHGGNEASDRGCAE